MERRQGGAFWEDALQPASRFGPYLVEQKLGEGATGVVYKATDERDGSTVVALKVLRRMLADDPMYVSRFRREAQIAREVRHRNLVPVVDAGEIDDRPFLATCYYAGGSLQTRIRQTGVLGVRETLRATAHIAAALDTLAERGLVHRDVKPGNVMLDEDDRAALTDFGLARGPAHTVLTRAGQQLGTVEFMAPELCRGEPATPLSDVYALGCLVYQCLAGHSPFHAEVGYQVAYGHQHRPPPDLRTERPELPQELATTVVLALEKDPALRPRTAMTYAHLLQVSAR